MLILALAASSAEAQVALSEIVVTAPSPIRSAGAAGAGTGLPSPGDTLLGTLPIVTGQFATVTVVAEEELRRSNAATLGDLLFSKPGITGSSFAPGAASRPIIRGLDVNRVGITENGISGGGVSDLGEDHFVPVDPIVADQVEVIRGPATLRYGSQSIGGVVEARNNRIPEALPCGTVACVRGELRGGVRSAEAGIDGAILFDAGANNVAIHADVFGRNSPGYGVPGYPYRTTPDPADAPRATQPGAFSGTQPNSGTRSSGLSAGASYVFTGGFAGLAVTQTNALYHIPGIDGENHNTRIDARQTKLTGKAEWRAPFAFVDSLRLWAGATDYSHNEIGLEDPLDLFTDGVRQTFTNREFEGRAEIALTPFDLRFASLTTALGIQAGVQRLTAPGDVPGPLSGLFDPNDNRRIAGYVFNEFTLSDSLKAQLAGRIEQVNLSGTTPDILAGSLAPLARNPNFTPVSASFGVIQKLPLDLAASLTAQYVERAPKPAELFSRGPHDATGTFDIGNPGLGIEKAFSVEAGLRRARGPWRFEATAYVTRFSGFIFRNLTGETCDETPNTCTGAPFFGAGGEVQQAVYSQRDALFRGAEFQSQLDVAPLWNGLWGAETQFDVVRATFDGGGNVPRIPPMRLGGGLFYRDAEWLARVNLLHAFAQDDFAATGETATPGYNRLRAEISRTRKLRGDPSGLTEITTGIVGDNLLNEDIRNHVSYRKDDVLMPGASVRLFANLRF